MTKFEDATVAAAPAEEIWKLLVDPTRYPDWWAGIASVDYEEREPGEFTLYHPDEPGLPWPQRVERHDDGRVVISCMTSEIRYDWQLSPENGGTRIEIAVEVPDAWREHVDSQRELIAQSLERLVALTAR